MVGEGSDGRGEGCEMMGETRDTPEAEGSVRALADEGNAAAGGAAGAGKAASCAMAGTVGGGCLRCTRRGRTEAPATREG